MADSNPRDDKQARAAARLDIARWLPPIRVLSALGVLIAFGLLLLPQATGRWLPSWSSGPLSGNHGMIAHDCAACHKAPFERVSNESCLSCHNMTQHDAAADDLKCASCHMEHNGSHGLILDDSRPCSECHGAIKTVKSETLYSDVRSFDSHPEFDVPGSDPTTLKLNHKLHLEPDLRSRDGTRSLQCRDCHELGPDLRTIKKISFDKHCRDCHSLEFDERLPGNEVPHGDADVVFNYLYAEYSKLFLAEQEEAPREIEAFPRFRPGQVQSPEARVTYVRKFVAAESRVAEKVLFTRSACHLCHEISSIKGQPPLESTGELSAFKVEKPKLPERWLPNSVFSHGAHEEISCDSCHAGVEQSEKTADVLLPRLEKCQGCHTEVHQRGTVKSSCVMCHSYHDSLPYEPAKKRKIEEIVKFVAAH